MRDTRERGAAMVEFAIIVPVLLLLVLGTIEFGTRYQKASVINNAAFIGAREFSVSGDIAKARAAAATANGGVVPPGFPASLPACTPNANVSVIFDSSASSTTNILGATYTIHAKGVARCEG